MIELPSYHVAKAKVHLLSPQVLFGLTGGQSIQTTSNISLNLDNGVELVATYCPCSRLPILPMTFTIVTCNLWSDAFVYTDHTSSVYINILGQLKNNWSGAQKETLLWHQRLSHASIPWVQLLMCNCKWLKAHSSHESLHVGPFIYCKEPHGPVCNISCLKCASCIAAKATICKPGIWSGGLQPPSQEKLWQIC